MFDGADRVHVQVPGLGHSRRFYARNPICLVRGRSKGRMAIPNLGLRRKSIHGSSTSNSVITFLQPSSAHPYDRCYLITHAHLDHVNSLVLSAGSMSGSPRRIYAVEQALKDIEGIFSDRLWPNLASWNEKECNTALIYSRYADTPPSPV